MKSNSLSGVLLLSVLCFCLGGCDLFEYHPYSTKISGRRDINEVNSKAIEKAGIKVPFKFAFITDTQGSLDETAEALEIIKKRGDIDFIVHGGDQADFGLPKEFMWCRDLLETTGLPYVAVIGNHDCLGNGDLTFDYIYGPENFTFNVDCAHFVCLNTNAFEYDYSRPVPDFDFMEQDIIDVREINEQTPDSITHTIVVMHAHPYDDQFNNNVAKPFSLYLEQYPGLRGEDDVISRGIVESDEGTKAKGFCVNGHNHNIAVTDIFKNGTLYYQCPNAGKKSFFVFTITAEGYEFEHVEF